MDKDSLLDELNATIKNEQDRLAFALEMKKFYDSYIQAGFNEDQAFFLTQIMFTKMIEKSLFYNK